MWHSVMRNLLNRQQKVVFFLPHLKRCLDPAVIQVWERRVLNAELNEIEYLGAVISIFATAAQNPQMLQITDDTFRLMTIPQVNTITSKTTIPQVKRQWQDLLQLWTCLEFVVFMSIVGDIMTLANYWFFSSISEWGKSKSFCCDQLLITHMWRRG